MRILAAVGAMFFILCGTMMPSVAQVDVGKLLVGKWEGDLERPQTTRRSSHPLHGRGGERRENTRILRIDKIREQGGKWVVEKASFGEEGKRPKQVEVSLHISGGEVSLEFETDADATVKLRLSGDNVLSGTWIHTGKFQKLEMKKVE